MIIIITHITIICIIYHYHILSWYDDNDDYYYVYIYIYIRYLIIYIYNI